MENAIHPRLSEILNSNVGNTLTTELSVGLQGTLQQLINTVANEAYAAGMSAQREQGNGGSDGGDEVVDVDAREAGDSHLH